MNELLEKLAELEHDQWMSWTKYLVENEPSLFPSLISKWYMNWKPYADLSEEEKEKDRIWARKALQIIDEINHHNPKKRDYVKFDKLWRLWDSFCDEVDFKIWTSQRCYADKLFLDGNVQGFDRGTGKTTFAVYLIAFNHCLIRFCCHKIDFLICQKFVVYHYH